MDLLVEQSGSALILTLNRPDKYNAVLNETLRDIACELDRAASSEDIHSVIITGAGKAFCSGGDVSTGTLTETDVDIQEAMDQGINSILKKIEILKIPVIAAVNGITVGAGLGLALGADITIAARSASFFPSFSRMGLSLDGGTSHFFVKRAGMARAKAMCLLGEKISSEEAVSAGLIWKVVEDGDLMETALRTAQTLAERAPIALSLIKDQLAQASSNSLDQALEIESRYIAKAFATEDFQEGLAALQEKRRPEFKGK